MNRKSFILVFFAFFLHPGTKAHQTASPQNAAPPKLFFTENKGQVVDQHGKPRPDVLYGTTSGDLAVHIRDNGVSYQLERADSRQQMRGKTRFEKLDVVLERTVYRIDLSWLGHNPSFTASEKGKAPGHCHYYGEGSGKGILAVKSYKEIFLKDLYPGIDLRYYEKNGRLKHDYIVSAHADHREIKVKVEGATIRMNSDGSILLETPLGTVQEGAPIVFQNGKQLEAHWMVSNNVLSFDIKNVDPRYELIIDPMTRIWGTYYGGGPNATTENGCGTATDPAGNVYMSGFTACHTSTVIATTGSHQTTLSGIYDAFLVKFDPAGTRIWSTYYGGSYNESGFSCATDGLGNVFMCGRTASPNSGGNINSIATANAHQTSFGGQWDAFLVKFDANGYRVWGTFYGGVSDDEGLNCTTDKNGNVFMVGITSSSANISGVGGHDMNYSGGSTWKTDGFLVKFNSNGVRQWATYYGGTRDDETNGCATDTIGNVFITGVTESTGVIATFGTFQHQVTSQYFKVAYLAKFNTNGQRQWGTYYGNLDYTHGLACATDPAGNVYMAGAAIPASFGGIVLTTPDGHQSAYGGGNGDGLLVKFNTNGARIWGTFYGASGSEHFTSCSIDKYANIYVAGYTASLGNDLATPNVHQPTNNGNDEAFIVKFNANSILQWCSYYGTVGDETGESCTADNMGAVYLSGSSAYAYYADGMTTPGSHQPAYGGGSTDCYLVKFDGCDAPPQPPFISGKMNACADSMSVQYGVTPMPEAFTYTWKLPPSWPGSTSTTTITTIPLSSGVITVMANNICGASLPQTLSVTLHGLPTVTAATGQPEICAGESVILSAGGAVNYTFSPLVPSGNTISASPLVTTSYTVYGSDSIGCINSVELTQLVNPCTGVRELNRLGSMLFYPNPNNGSFILHLPEARTVEITDMLGHAVFRKDLLPDVHHIELQDLAKGIYFIRSASGNLSETAKIVIE